MVCGGYLAQLYMVKSFLVKHQKTRQYTPTLGGTASFRPLPHRAACINQIYLRYINAEECSPCDLRQTSQAYFFVNILPKFTISGMICPPITLTKSPLLFRMTARINAYYGELKTDCQKKNPARKS
ncbi:MAG: hypothetical protein D3903_17885 [Candidatus Electrothrix sp. GM3_4]|nr:hypothetical protein [Candidatus Electrothrix sp. GM3_4]